MVVIIICSSHETESRRNHGGKVGGNQQYNWRDENAKQSVATVAFLFIHPRHPGHHELANLGEDRIYRGKGEWVPRDVKEVGEKVRRMERIIANRTNKRWKVKGERWKRWSKKYSVDSWSSSIRFASGINQNLHIDKTLRRRKRNRRKKKKKESKKERKRKKADRTYIYVDSAYLGFQERGKKRKKRRDRLAELLFIISKPGAIGYTRMERYDPAKISPW